MSIPAFCLNMPQEAALYEVIERHMRGAYPDITVKHDRTQTAFVRKVQFAWVSLPRKKADRGGVMLSIGLPGPVQSPRMLHVTEAAPGRWMHHMMLRTADDLDDEVRTWLEQAWALVGPGRRG